MYDEFNTRQTLIERVKNQHDNASWEEFVHIYRGYIYTVIRNMGIPESDREELIQQTLIKLWKKLPDFNCNHFGRFRSWLSTLTKNCVIDFIRKNKREAVIQEKVAKRQQIQPVNTILPDIDRTAEQAWKQHLTTLALNNIELHFSGKAITVFRLSLQGMEVTQIAEKLSIQQASVYRLKTRVKARLIEEVRRLRNELE